MTRTLPKASLIYNPNAGRRRHGRTIAAIKATLGGAYELRTSPTTGPKDAIRLGREAAQRGDAAVFAWGGDGTIREVVEGLLGSPTCLGVLPGGTFNVVALALGLPRTRPVEAAIALVRESTRAAPRDVGLVGATPFLMQATAGLDGFLMHHLSAEMKARYGIAGVIIDGVRAFLRYRFPSFTVGVDGVGHEVTGAAFVNMAEYAGAFQFVPGARWDDQTAHVLLYHGRTRLSAFSFAVSLGLGRHHRRADVIIKEASEMSLPKSSHVYVQTDGDPWRGELPVTCRLADERIQVLIPNA